MFLGRRASATDVPFEAHVEALLAQVPRNRARTCRNTGWSRNPEFTQSVEVRQNAERLLSDTKEKAIRIANDLKRLNRNWPVPVKRAAVADCRDRASRFDLAQLLVPDAAGEPTKRSVESSLKSPAFNEPKCRFIFLTANSR